MAWLGYQIPTSSGGLAPSGTLRSTKPTFARAAPSVINKTAIQAVTAGRVFIVGSISMQPLHEPKPTPPGEPVFANGPMGAPPGHLPVHALFGTPAQWRRDLAIAAAAGLFLGVAGPFGSYVNPSRLTVIAYWVGAILTGELLLGVTIRPATLLAPRWRIPPLLAALAVTTIVAFPLSLICHTAAMLLWPFLRGHISLLTFYGQTLLVSAVLTTAHVWTERPPTPVALNTPLATPPPEPTPIPGDFLSRLPRHLGRDLIALQMEDHYVRVHTSSGSALVLIPLRQALAELGAIPGLRVHRSWWVARHAVTGTVADGRNVRLRLVNGLEAPVSRANVAEARLFVGE